MCKNNSSERSSSAPTLTLGRRSSITSRTTAFTPSRRKTLAVLYLRTLRLKEAGKLFGELDGMGRENPKEHSIGVAGEAVIATLQKDYRKSQSLIYDLGDLTQRRTQLSTDLWQMLQLAGAINAKELGEQENKQLQELFEGEP